MDFEIVEDDGPPLEDVQRGEAGSKVVCLKCDKEVVVKQDGTLRQHNCVRKAAPAPKKNAKVSATDTPPGVRNLGIAVIAGVAEYGAKTLVGRYVPCDPQLVPADMGPAAPMMCGPIVDLAWPSIPAEVQKFLARIADERELIACAVAWVRWTQKITSFARETRQARIEAQSTGGNVNGHFSRPAERPNGFNLGNVQPFPYTDAG